MLVLSRKLNQSIMIGDAIRIVVVGFDGDQVKLGIEAPSDVPIHRFEIFQRIARGEPSAAAADSPRPVGKASAGADNPGDAGAQ